MGELDRESRRLAVGAAADRCGHVFVGRPGSSARPAGVAPELRYQTFHRYCELNVALEGTAELAYRRLIELARDDEERDIFERIREDEERHGAAFRLLAAAPDRRRPLAQGPTGAAAGGAGGPQPLVRPGARGSARGDARPRDSARRRPRRGPQRPDDADRGGSSRSALTGPGSPTWRRGRRRRSGFVHARLRPPGPLERQRSGARAEALAGYLHRHGVADVAVLEAPTVYGNCSRTGRSTRSPNTSGSTRPSYRIVDIGKDLRPYVSSAASSSGLISGTWLDAGLRIVMPKLRTDPTEFAHSDCRRSRAAPARSTRRSTPSRRIDFRSATMMLLDVAPPDFSVVDAWAPVADGPFGVMGCRSPAQVRHVYAGADALAVDEVVLGDLGIADPAGRRSFAVPTIGSGCALSQPVVDGDRPPLHDELAAPTPPRCSAPSAPPRTRSTST